MALLFKTLSLVLGEALSSPRLVRRPEPVAVMDDPRSVASFHEQGVSALLPIYQFNALAISHLAPVDGLIVDLGSGSGQFLSYLARHRPDLRMIGLDLSEAMVSLGRETLDRAGLTNQVDLRIGDMVDFSRKVPEGVDLITSVFSLHHLPDVADLRRCVAEMALVRKRYGAGVWVFDHARPRNPRTADEFPEVFSPTAAQTFREDSRNSLIASYSFQEMTQAFDGEEMGTIHHKLSNFLRLYQAHWIEGRSSCHYPQRGKWRHDSPLPPDAVLQFERLRNILRGVPLDTPVD